VPDSLRHYGEVDTLASFCDKESFITYVSRLEKEEEKKASGEMEKICPGCHMTFLTRNDFKEFLNEKGKDIAFAMVSMERKADSIFLGKPFYIKLLKEKNMNVLEIRDTNIL